MSSSTSWDDFRLVSAIAEAGSLVGAAEKLGINHSTVFRRLGSLERSLGARLFERSRSGYEPTPAGAEMVSLANRISENISDFERGVAGRDVKPAGILRVTTNDTFVSHLLTPILASFKQAYPDINLEVIVTHQALNLSRRDADVAIRATRDPPETLVGRRLTTFAWCRYVPRTWTENGRRIDPARESWIGYGDGLLGLPARVWLENEIETQNINCRFDTLIGVAHAIACGMGMGALPCFIGDTMDEVVRTGDTLEFGDALWVLTHPDLRNSARVRAFMDHAATELGKMKGRIQGRL